MPLSVGRNQDVIEAKEGGGALIIVGLFFLGFSLFIILAALGIFGGKSDPEGRIAGVLFGTIFIIMSGLIIFVRRGVSCDVANKTVITWWSIFGLRKKTEHALDDFHHVTVQKEIRRSKNSTYIVYPVQLVGNGQPIKIEESRQYKTARATAEQLAQFIGKNILDSSSGETVERTFDHLDESLRERVRRTGETLEVPETPSDMESDCRVEGREMVITIPAEGFKPIMLLYLAIPLVIAALALFLFIIPLLTEKGSPSLWRYLLAGFLSIVFVLIPILIGGAQLLGREKNGTVIIASPDRLQVTRRAPFSSRKITKIPAVELEELIYPPARLSSTPKDPENCSPVRRRPWNRTPMSMKQTQKGIVARSDTESVEFGGHLSNEELRWIHAKIMKVLTTNVIIC